VRKRTSTRPSPAERLENPAAFLSRSDLAQLGLERRAVDAVFRACPVISLPGYSRPLIRVCDYLELVERSTYRDDRVRPIGRQEPAGVRIAASTFGEGKLDER
jgi:hypothetical protein